MSSGISVGSSWAPPSRVQVGDHVHQVDHAAELVLGADRQLDRDARGRRAASAGPRAPGKVRRSRSSRLTSTSRRAPARRSAPQPLGADLDAEHAGRRRSRPRPRAGQHVGLEAGLAGRVDQVDLAVLPLQVGDRRRDRHAAPALLLVVVEAVDFSATLPSRLIVPDSYRSASTSEVLPVPRWPITATLRIFRAPCEA